MRTALLKYQLNLSREFQQNLQSSTIKNLEQRFQRCHPHHPSLQKSMLKTFPKVVNESDSEERLINLLVSHPHCPSLLDRTAMVTDTVKYRCNLSILLNFVPPYLPGFLSEMPIRGKLIRPWPCANTRRNMCSTLGQDPGLAHKHQTRLEKPARDKHSSLL